MSHYQSQQSEAQGMMLSGQRNHPTNPPLELYHLAQKGAIHRLVYPDGHLGWIITSYTLIQKVLSDPRFSARSEFKRAPIARPGIEPFYGQPALPGWLVDMDPPQHTQFRRALSNLLSLKQMKSFIPRVQQVVDQHLMAIKQMSPPIDLVAHFALPIPSLMICELLGVPYGQRQLFQHHSAILFSLKVDAETAAKSMDYLTDFLNQLIRQKRKSPKEDILSKLIALNQFSDQEIAGMGVLLLTAGHETTTNMLALGTLTLLIHPTELAKLRSKTINIDCAVEELLRYLTIFHFGIPRTPLEDVQLEGQLIKAGESITLSLPIANRDPNQFENPDKLDLTRHHQRHFAFGYGVHYCLGMHLARIELQIGLSMLFETFPLLHLAESLDNIKFNTQAGLYGLEQLMVGW